MTTTESDSPTSILDAIKARLFSGDNIRPGELANAEAAVRAEEIAAEGRRHRAAEQAAKDVERRREQAKTDAAGALAAHSVGDVLAVFDEARAAVEALRTAISRHNTAVVDAAKILDSAGLPASNGYGVEQEPNHDPRNHALYPLHGASPHAVVVDGTQHDPLDYSTWVHAVGHAAGARSLQQKAHYPAALRRHLGIRELGEAA